ncbi:MAG: histidinol-phosphate transaminase [Firmicutes bacterium]|nr:histidinol-phosphate transaminase [Bacillota bacterium]
MRIPSHRPAIERITPYVPGKPIAEVQEEYGLENIIKLASNENPLGPSPLAMEALKEAISGVHIYPDGAARDLRNAIAKKYGVSSDEVFVGNGSDEIIKLLAEAFLLPDDEVIFADATFSEYAYATRLMGAREVVVPVREETHDLTAMAERITERTKIVFICNPNNPTGTYVNAEAVDAFLEKVPEGVLVVLDEAYVEYVDAADFPNAIDLICQGRLVATMRTFSKIYGLAGLRVGYIIAPRDVVALLNRVKEPFNVNLLAQKAALAALDDTEHLERSRETNSQGKAYLYAAFADMGLRYCPTQANFIFVDIGRPCRPVYERLLQEGVIVRTGDIFDRPTFLRVTIGTQEENERFIAALRRALAVG